MTVNILNERFCQAKLKCTNSASDERIKEKITEKSVKKRPAKQKQIDNRVNFANAARGPSDPRNLLFGAPNGGRGG